MIPDFVEFALTHTGEGQRKENEQHIFAVAKVVQRHRLLVLVAQREVRRQGANGEHQRRPARDLGVTSRLELQSPRLADDVCINPAVGADSAISAGRTWPGLPVFGLSTQMTPSSARGGIEAINLYTRSPSPSRHQSNTTSMTSSASSSNSSPAQASSMSARMLSSVSSSQPSSCTT